MRNSNVTRRMNSRLALASLFVAFCCQANAVQAQYLGGSPQGPVNSLAGVTTNAETVQALLHAPKPSLVLHPGDSLSVQVFEIEHYDYKTRVASDGTISLPLIDAVALAGKTTEQAEAAIVERLETLGMVRNPHVHVTASDQPSEFFTVAGEVNKPGTFPAYGARTLLAAIAQGGGLKPEASRNVTLLRAGAAQGYVLNLGSDPSTSPVGAIPVYSGDTVLVGSVGVIYVVGAVKLSGVYKLKTSTPTTVEQAIAEAGGAGYEAARSETRIVRVVDGKRVQIAVNLRKTMHGKAEDPVLQADDILFIPTNEMRAALKGGGANLAVGLATAAIIR